MNPVSQMLTTILMFIGGSSGSTAGGVKTTTIAVLLLCVVANLRNRDEIVVFNYRIALDTVKRAISVTLTNLSEIFIGILTSLIFALSFVVVKPKTTTQKLKGEFMVG